MIIERGIALRDTFQFVVEIDYDFAKRNHKVQLHTVAGHILLFNQLAPLVEA